MGGKQSSESGPSQARTFDHRPGSSGVNGVSSSTRRSTVTVGTLDSGSRRQMLRFDPALLPPGTGQLDSRLARTNSAVESGLQIPRAGFEWFYANHLHDSDSSPEEEGTNSTRIFSRGRRNISHSLPPYFLSPARDSKCPMCGKTIPAEDVEVHFVMCLTKPRVTYNEDVMSTTSGECAICLEDLEEGEPIARLPCLCIYHKVCIDQWFVKSQTCPEHPPD